MTSPPWYGGAEIGKTPMAMAVSFGRLASTQLRTLVLRRLAGLGAMVLARPSHTMGPGEGGWQGCRTGWNKRRWRN